MMFKGSSVLAFALREDGDGCPESRVESVFRDHPWSLYWALEEARGLGGLKNKNRETKAFGNREIVGRRHVYA